MSEGSLDLVTTTPEDGKTNVPIDNVGIKLYFSGNVTDESVWEGNSHSFALTDSEGNEIDYLAYSGQEIGESNYILVIAKPEPIKEGQPGQLVQDSGYKLTIKGDIKS